MIRLSLLALAFFCCQSLQAQSTDSADFTSVAYANAYHQYAEATKMQALVFNGGQYKEFDGLSREFPYYLSEESEEGSVTYDHQLYRNISLRYDLVDDVVVLEHYDQNGYHALIGLNQKKVQDFTLAGHYFINNPDFGKGVVRAGYFEVLHNGKTKLLVKRKKTVAKEIVDRQEYTLFVEKSNYFIVRDGVLHPVKGKASVLDVFADHKKQMRQFINKRNLNFLRYRQMGLLEVVKYFESIEVAQ